MTAASSGSPRHRVLYCLRRFPVLSETFIQREMLALRRHDVDLVIVAEASDPLDSFGDAVRALARSTYYGPAWGPLGYLACVAKLACKNPRAVLRTAASIRRERYSRFKSLREDARLLGRVAYLALVAGRSGVTHIHAPWAAINAYVAMRAAALCGAVFTVHVRAFELYSPRDRYLLAEKMSAARFVVTNTEYNRQRLLSRADAWPMPPIHRIYNGVDVSRFDPPSRAPISSRRTCQILCVARLVEQKGIEHLLRACRQLLDGGADIHCHIVGGPFPARYARYHRDLLRLAETLALQGHVAFCGAMPFGDVLDRYRRADLFVLPCVIEKDGNRDVIPNAIIEAMALELPVVASNLVGIPEMIDDGVHGLLVPPGDAGAVADAIARLMADPPRAARIGRNARRRVEQRFDIDRNVEVLAGLFSSLDLPAADSAAVRRPTAVAALPE